MTGRTLASAMALALLSIAPARAADFAWALNAGIANTDNADRAETDGISDSLVTAGAELDFAYESRRVTAELTARGTYLDYLDNTYDDDFLASANGTLVFGIVPERFLWTFENTFGQITIDQFEPVTPDNRQNANFFSTGPDFYLRFGPQLELEVSGRYSEAQYQDTNSVNDQRLSGQVALLRRVSPTTLWGVGGQAMRVDYDLPGSPGYDQQEVFGRLDAEGARQTLTVQIGATRVADAGESNTNPLLRLAWTRRLTPSWTLDINGGTEYRNTADRFVADAGQGNGGTGSVNISNVPAETYFGGARFSFERPRTRFSIGASVANERYPGATEPDQDTWGLSADVSRRFRERLTGFVDARYEERDFGSLGAKEDTTTLGARIEWAAGRTVFLTAGYRYEDRSGTGAFTTYKENLFYLSVSYRRGEIQSTGFAY